MFRVNKYVLLAIFLSFFIFMFHYIEIFEIFNRASYFSDSENYYKASLKFPPDEYDAYYFVYTLSLIRVLSSYGTALFFLFLTYSGLILLFFQKFQLNKFNLIFLFHPFIIFIFARGLKESLIMIVFVLLMRLYNFEKSIFSLNIIIIICVSFFFEGLKPMGL